MLDENMISVANISLVAIVVIVVGASQQDSVDISCGDGQAESKSNKGCDFHFFRNLIKLL